MKEVGGIWLPEEEQHLVEWMTNMDKRVNGKLTYQYHKLEEAVGRVPVHERRVAVDVGAHVGLWSMHLARMFDHVFAFEPNAELAECFERNVPYQNVTRYQMALGYQAGRVSLRSFEGNTGHSMNTGVQAGGTIPMGTLDAMELTVCDFIKIDVEGYEAGVVKGALETIKRCRPVMIVEEKGFAHEHGFVDGKAVRVLQELGMKVACNLGGDHIMVWA